MLALRKTRGVLFYNEAFLDEFLILKSAEHVFARLEGFGEIGALGSAHFLAFPEDAARGIEDFHILPSVCEHTQSAAGIAIADQSPLLIRVGILQRVFVLVPPVGAVDLATA